jgi:hypothetical protein
MLSHHKTGGMERLTPSSLNNIRIQNNSVVVMERERYSASVLDLETTACFLALQDIRQSPKNTANPVVDRRSSGHPA